MRDFETLRSIFQALGASPPESWARSEVEENIPQLAIFLFLRAAWKCVVPDNDPSWIHEARMPPEHPNAPGAGLGPALDRLIAKGADLRDINAVVRNMQYALLFNLCRLTEDWTQGREDLPRVSAELDSVRWALFEIDEEQRPLRKIACIHESVLSMDPTGREMRPMPPSAGTASSSLD
jgi:hypothetical protein